MIKIYKYIFKDLKKYFYICILILILMTIFLSLYFILYNNQYAITTIRELHNQNKNHPENGSFINIFINNISISFFTYVLCLIPLVGFAIFFISQLNTAYIFSLIFFDCYYNNKNFIYLFSIQVLPHGIIEIPVIIIKLTLCLYISYQTLKGLRQSSYSLKSLFLKVAYGFLFFNLPLFLIAALLEAYITPIIIKTFI